MPARLIAAIIRHGDYRQLPDTPSAHQPFPLTASGEHQARRAAARIREVLNDQGWALDPVVDCSQLLRAWQTAEIIVDGLRDRFPREPQLTAHAALAERGLGSANNLSLSMIETVISEDPRFPELPDDWKSNSQFRLPLQGAESLLEAGQRVAAHMRQQMAALAGFTAADTLKLFVGHGAAFRHAAFHLGVLEYEQIARLSMHHASPVYLEYSDGTWSHVGGDWRVRNAASAYTD